MATFAGDSYEDFKEEVLEQLRYRKDEKGLTWGQVLKAVVEVLAYLMEWEKDEWRQPNGEPTYYAGRKGWN